VHLSVEDHGGSFLVPIHDEDFLARFPDLSGAELGALLGLAEAAEAIPGCRPLDRAAWPGVCDARIAGDLAALLALTASVPSAREVPS
jgi:hypothetical protein